jgi:hypothetical protein
MEKVKDFISTPAIGAGVPIVSTGLAEFCYNLIPFLSMISLTIGIFVGLLSLYLNLKKMKDGQKDKLN